MRKFLVSLLTVSILCSVCGLASARQPAQVRYQSRYQLLGFLLRSFSVCPGATKQSMDVAFNLVGGPEYQSLSRAYPETTKNWMTEGAGNFNNMVMRDGIRSACKHAKQALRRAKRT